MYDVTAAYRFGEDKLKFDGQNGYVSENIIGFGAVLGQVFAKSHKVLFDVGFDAAITSGSMKAQATELTIAPHYVMTKGRWNLDLGVRLDKVIRPTEMEHYSTKDQLIYPDLNVRFAVIPDAMSMYTKIGGGNQLHTYSSLLERNPFTDYNFGGIQPLMNFTSERVSVLLGVDGRISRRFTYDIHAGYANVCNGLLDAVFMTEDGSAYLPGFGYATYNKLFAALNMTWRTDDISLDADLQYAYHTGLENAVGLFEPSTFTGDVAFEYNWNRRVFAGVDCEFATMRKGLIGSEEQVARIPGYADLGVYGEYAPNRKLSFWLRGGNLMNMTIQRTALYAEKGINFTAGICLKF